MFNGYIKDIDSSTGQDINPYIISVMVDKNIFNSIDMSRIDKLKCLKQTMQGRIDIGSNLCFKEITPIAKCDYLNKSVISSESINLLEVDPFALESLVCTLFRNMGYEVIETKKTREFESVLRNSDAMKGIFISTSNFSSQCEKFASENNISLINGSLLVDYFNRYGINSYILHK